jgi:hypothetical protein
MFARLYRRLVAVGLLVIGLLLITPSAFAAGSGMRNGYSLALNSFPTVLAGLCGLASAQLTALLTNHQAPQWIKSGVHLLISTLAGVLVTVAVVPGNRWTDYLSEIAVAWVAGIAAHFAGLTALVASITANSGLGASVTPLVVSPQDVPVTPVDAGGGTTGGGAY